MELPEGNYTFTADANGYLQKVATEHISWDSVHPIDLTQAVAPRASRWRTGARVSGPERALTSKESRGFILFPKPLSYVQFTIHAQGGKTRAHWLLHYVNEKNYIQCVIDDDGFRAMRISEAKSEVIASKKGVPKSEWYPISIEIRSNGATLSLQKGTAQNRWVK